MSLHLTPDESRRLYSQLFHGARTIRLAVLYPGAWSEPISCQLNQAVLGAQGSYKALSYAWRNDATQAHVDEPTVVKPIFINSRRVDISPNLHSALRRLRHHQEYVQVWVDSLCINQKDLSERARQVGLMRDIYENCSEVIIWLGEPTPNDDLRSAPGPGGSAPHIKWYGDSRDIPKVDEYFKAVPKGNQQNLSNPGAADVFGAFVVIHMLASGIAASKIWHLRHIKYATDVFNGFSSIMSRSWWRRVWVVQETVVAKKATIWFGNISAPWSMFSIAALNYENSRLAADVDSIYPSMLHGGQALAEFSKAVIEIESTRRDWRVKPTPLFPLLRKFRARDATDRRDKVFALLGLVTYGQGKDIIPDYHPSAETVFRQLTTRLIAETQSLDMLAGTLQQNSEKWGLNPSWVTDWSCPSESHENARLENIRLYNTSKSMSGMVQLHGQFILETRSKYIDDIIFVDQELPLVRDRMRAVVARWDQSVKEYMGTEAYIGGGFVPDAFWRTICGDTMFKESKPGNTLAITQRQSAFEKSTSAGLVAYEEWRFVNRSQSHRRTSIIGGYWQESSVSTSHVMGKNAFHEALQRASGRRRLFITSMGYIGIGCNNVAVGDSVFVVCGSRVPFVLRRASRSETCKSNKVEVLIGAAAAAPSFIAAGAGARLPAQNTTKQAKEICTDTHGNCYFVVGDAYVHGIMNGEVLAQPQTAMDTIFLV